MANNIEFTPDQIESLMGVRDLRLDSSPFISEQLYTLEAEVIEQAISPMDAMRILNVTDDLTPAKGESIYRRRTAAGKANFLEGNETELPTVDSSATKVTQKNGLLGIGVPVSDIDQLTAQANGMDLLRDGMMDASTILWEKINETLLRGNTAHGLPGLFSDPNVKGGEVAAITSSTDPETAFNILYDLANAPGENSDGAYRATRLAIPATVRNILAKMEYSTGSNDTVLRRFFEVNENISSNELVSSYNLEAGKFSDGRGRAIALDPSKIGARIMSPQVWKVVQMPLGVMVIYLARVSGVLVKHPLSARTVKFKAAS